MLTKALLLLSALALSVPSQAQTASGQSNYETCSTGFIEAFKKVVIEIKTIAVYVKDGEKPPNIPQALKACNTLERSFPNNRCEIGTQTVSTAQLGEACSSLRELANSLGVQAPAEVPPPTAWQVNDATPVSALPHNGLVVQVNNAAEIHRAMTNPKLFYFIGGQTFDFQSSILVQSGVRCTLALPPPANSVSAIGNGNVLRSSLIAEQTTHDHMYTRIALSGANWTIDCSKHEWGQAKGGITFGELRHAFGSVLSFSYVP